jgi:hypothetical protein
LGEILMHVVVVGEYTWKKEVFGVSESEFAPRYRRDKCERVKAIVVPICTYFFDVGGVMCAVEVKRRDLQGTNTLLVSASKGGQVDQDR